MALTLYCHPLSSYCHKVLIALYEHDIAFVPRVIDLGDPDERAELQALWPLCKFPLLHDDVRQLNLPEATIIIEYLDHHFPGHNRLLPHEFDDAIEARLWDRVFDNYVQGPVQEIVGNHLRGTKDDLSAAHARLDVTYHLLDARLGARTWIAGTGFSLADCAAAPALFYACTLQPFPPECTALQRYFDRLMQRPSVQRVIAEARPWFHLYPFKDAIAQRFLQDDSV